MRTVRGCSRFVRALGVCLLVFAGGVGCTMIGSPPAAEAPPGPRLPGQSDGVFATGNATVGIAFRDFLGRRPEPVQPIEFPHNIHVGKQIGCTEYCHETVTMGPRAGLPSVNTCMICHAAIATDRPRIQQITKLQAEGRDLAWQRVFDYPEEVHVKFNHAPHIRAKVGCETCHGNIGEQTVAQRNVELTMGTCVNCHNERKAPIDCLTCHF
jgi:hypothetical protein